MEEIKTEKIHLQKGKIPDDYHCDCKWCQKYLGMLIRKDGTKYNKLDRNKYYRALEHSEKIGHIAKTPLHVARWAIQKYTQVGDLVLDPTIGAGTTAVEALNHGRFIVGMELQFIDVVKENIRGNNPYKLKYWVRKGDARNIRKYIEEISSESEYNLVVNNPPYSGDESQKGFAEHGRGSYKYDKSFPNLAFLKEGEEYYKEMKKIYSACADFLLPGGHFVVGVKDMMKNKMPFLLHIIYCKILEALDLRYVGMVLLPHYPSTLFMNTYNKRFPGIKIPRYQTINIFRKIK